MANDLRVHLDHLIKRQSLRYKAPEALSRAQSQTLSNRSDQNIRFDDIHREDSWFSSIVKPDFQRATCAWDANTCVTFLRSVLRRRIIPSIILWRSSETQLVYVLDGAHRLSVLRAWMTDDWGDKAGDFYAKNENLREIQLAANYVRDAVNSQIGAFSDFIDARREWDSIALRGGAPMQTMCSVRAERAAFHLDAFASNRALHAQWEEGDYAAAEESFLAINRQGAPLDAVESQLIEYRNGSMARVIMSIANAGALGHYWPEPPMSDPLPAPLQEKLASFDARCSAIHRILFIPPYDSTVRDINVPFIVAPGHFRLQQHLIEFVPLLTEGVAIGADQLPEILGHDSGKASQQVVANADDLLTRLERKIGHVGGRSNDSLSLALVPLIYWYNRKGAFGRALLYGWMHWLLSGTDEDIRTRKLALSAVRGELEDALIQFKDEFAEVQHRVGAGFKSLPKLIVFIQELINDLIELRKADEGTRSARLENRFGVKTSSRSRSEGKSRTFSKSARAQINVRALLGASVRCEICGGVVDLKQGVQYDHKQEFALGGATVPENGRATHPFCNLFRTQINEMRSGKRAVHLPALTETGLNNRKHQQLDLFDAFPGER